MNTKDIAFVIMIVLLSACVLVSHLNQEEKISWLEDQALEARVANKNSELFNEIATSWIKKQMIGGEIKER